MECTLKPGIGENTETVWLVDWSNPEANHFAGLLRKSQSRGTTRNAQILSCTLMALRLGTYRVEAVKGRRPQKASAKPLAIRSAHFIRPFFTTVQLVMAGNDVEGLRYERHRHSREVLASPALTRNRISRSLSIEH